MEQRNRKSNDRRSLGHWDLFGKAGISGLCPYRTESNAQSTSGLPPLKSNRIDYSLRGKPERCGGPWLPAPAHQHWPQETRLSHLLRPGLLCIIKYL